MVYAPAAATQVVYRVLVLGTPALDRDGLRLEVGRWQHRVQTLFLLLATAPQRHMRRDELIEILWPEIDADIGSGNLRTLVHRLRLVLGGDPPSVLSEQGWVALNPVYGWELDLERMETAVAEAEGDPELLEAALAFYRGKPLPDHQYEDWAIPLRDRAEQVWRDGVLRLAASYHARRRYADAALQYERVLAADPFEENALRGLLLALVHDGRRIEALRRYERFREVLDADIGLPPSEETELLIEQIRAQEEAPPERLDAAIPVGGFLGARPEGPLVGRQRELESLLLVTDVVPEGGSRLVLLAGESGVGKTRLAQEVMLVLRERGFHIATGRCSERDRTLLFGPFLELLAQLYAAAPRSVQMDAVLQWPQLVWLLPEGTIALKESLIEEQDEQRALFRAFAGFVRTLARERPVALMLDDLQWADDGSFALLHSLARETRGEAVFLLATYRDGEVSQTHPLAGAIRDMSREGLVDRIPLQRLGPDETTVLAEHLLGEDGPAELTEFVYRRTKGNPFHVVRMLRALGGSYRLLRQIGSGGMGRVFEAEDTRSGERVAVKLMFARTEADPKAVLRFRQEGAILAELHDPHIVQVRSTVVEEHASFIVMELLNGRSLAEVMQEESLSLERARTIAGQIATALASAHERGIVHRDIKPSNVMVLDADHVKVADFGVARLLRPQAGATSMTSTGMMMGTPSYMAPEQIDGRPVDGRTDVYALGATLYHLVTGRPPFESEDPFTVAFMHVHEPPIPPGALRLDLPDDWESLILRALAKDPADRFPSAMAMANAIDGLTTRERPSRAGSEPDAHPPVPAALPYPASGSLTTRKRRTAWRLAAALGPVPILLGALALFLWGQGSRPGGPGRMDGVTTVEVDPAGNVYAVDQGNGRFLEFSPQGTFLHAWGSHRPGLLQLSLPSDIAVGRHDIYVSDHAGKRIVHLHDGKPQSHIPVLGGALALDRQGNLYASDYYFHLIWHLTGGSGNWIGTLHVPMLWEGRADYPAGLDIGPDGLLYVADRQNDRIVVLRPPAAGNATSVAVIHIWGRRDPTGQHRFRRPGQFSSPSDVAVDSRGNIYVADTGNNRIQKLRWDGRRLRVVKVWGKAGTGLGQFNSPSSVTVDRHGNVYVADMYNSRVQKFSPDGRPLWATDGEHLQRAAT